MDNRVIAKATWLSRVFYSTYKTLHFFDENYDETNGVVLTCGRNLEMYWHYENLLLINTCEWPSTVVIENYFYRHQVSFRKHAGHPEKSIFTTVVVSNPTARGSIFDSWR